MRKRSSQKILLRLWKDLWKSLKDWCRGQFLKTLLTQDRLSLTKTIYNPQDK